MTTEEIVMGFVALLDEALLCDPVAMQALLRTRVPCTEKLVEHPTVQVMLDPDTFQNSISVLGLINGICDKLTGEKVCAVVDNATGEIQRFGIYMPPKEEINERDTTRGTGENGPGLSGS